MTASPSRHGARTARLAATWFGTGYAPKAPGTFGTLAGLPIHFALILLPVWGHGLALIGLTVLAIWSAGRVAVETGREDPQIVVIDEVVGVLLALFVVRDFGWLALIVGVGLFRLLDIFKPWPIGAAERLRPAGLGIVADDLVAGLGAGLVTWAIWWAAGAVGG